MEITEIVKPHELNYQSLKLQRKICETASSKIKGLIKCGKSNFKGNVYRSEMIYSLGTTLSLTFPKLSVQNNKLLLQAIKNLEVDKVTVTVAYFNLPFKAN